MPFSNLERYFQVLEQPFHVLERLFSDLPFFWVFFFWFFWEGDFVPGGVCLRIFAPALVLGQRVTGTRMLLQ